MGRAVTTAMRLGRATALSGVLLLVFAGAAQATVIPVTTTADPAGSGSCPGSPCSLRQAVQSAGTGDVIELEGSGGSPSVYALTQGGQLVVGSGVTIEGGGPGATVIDGSGNVAAGHQPSRIMRVVGSSVLVVGLTLTGGVDGEDEAFSGCSPCSTLNGNGGGAIFNQGGLTIEEVAFHSNLGSATPVGGAISNSGTLSISDSSFVGDGAAFGGGLFSRSGTVTGDGLTFDEDGTSAFGGGAVYLNGGSMTLTNTTVARSGWASSRGGGIEVHAGALTLRNDTLAENLRGSLQTDVGGTTTVQNTIIASGFSDNVDFDCVAPGVNASEGTTTNAITTDLGNNLDEDGACALSAGGDHSSVDPKLASIADNGGPVPTLALLHGSPAIGGAANGACPADDARGIGRPQGTDCDIGAFEARLLGSPSAATVAASGVGAGEATLNASIDLNGEAGGIRFLWGEAANALDEETPEVGAGVVSGANPVAYAISGLRGGRTYFFKALADNATGNAVAGNVLSFTTPPAPPALSDVSVIEVTDTTATVGATIDPAGADTTFEVEYGPDSSYGQTTTPVDIGSAAGPQEVTQTLTGLEPQSEYVLNLVARSAEAPAGVQSFGIPFETEPAQGRHLAVSVTGAGHGSVSGAGIDCPPGCGDDYPAGTSVTLTAAPAAGSEFAGWSGACSGSAGTCTLQLDSDRSVGAAFTVSASQRPPAPSNLFTVGKLKLNHKKGTGLLTVTTPGAGALSLSGKGIKPAAVSAAAAGQEPLIVAPTAKTMKKLRKTGRAKLSVSVTFTPTGGVANTQVVSLALAKKKKR